MVNYIDLKYVLPESVFTEISECATKFGLVSPLRLAHFLSQCAHESGNFKLTEENLNYSSKGLLKVFPKYFSAEEAEKYAHDRISIASRVYANRNGNSNEASQDGWKYRGRGYIQLTGKDNYAYFDKLVPENIISNPTLVATKYALLSAGCFWNRRNLNLLADKGSSEQVIKDITKKVNGGLNGLEDRIRYFEKFIKLIKDSV